jgi:hypothetical protein
MFRVSDICPEKNRENLAERRDGLLMENEL